MGSLAVTGSVPGWVLQPSESIVLHFAEGCLQAIEPDDNPTARWLYESQIQKAKGMGDPNWSQLAEIGVGVNRAVRNLTGNMLFDEKAAGTAHVALGSNSFMGGYIEAAIHCDLVTWRPTIIIDGKTILDHGSLRFVPSEWLESYAEVRLEKSPLHSASAVTRSGVQGDESTDGRLQRVLRPEPGRVSACFVGDEDTSRLASRLYGLLPLEGDWIPIEQLAGQALLDPATVRRVLHVMLDAGLVSVRY